MRRLLLELDPCGGTDPLGMFPLFLMRTADVMAPRLSIAFCGGLFVWVVVVVVVVALPQPVWPSRPAPH